MIDVISLIIYVYIYKINKLFFEMPRHRLSAPGRKSDLEHAHNLNYLKQYFIQKINKSKKKKKIFMIKTFIKRFHQTRMQK